MTQRAIVFETEEGGCRSVVDIVEWAEDRLDLNKRRLMKKLNRERSGDVTVLIEQVDGPKAGEQLYQRSFCING